MKINLKGVLIHGPSGIGKSLLVKQVLRDNKLEPNSFVVEPQDLIGDTYDKIGKIKKVFDLAKSVSNSLRVIWIEELDFITTGKDKECLYALLNCMDTVSSNILVIATTNQLDKVDKSIRRGGRLDIDIRLDTPSDQDRYLVFLKHLSDSVHNIDSEELRIIARASSGFVCSDIAQIVRNCQMRAINQGQKLITRQILDQQILESKPLSI